MSRVGVLLKDHLSKLRRARYAGLPRQVSLRFGPLIRRGGRRQLAGAGQPATCFKIFKKCITCRVTKSAADFHQYRYVTNQGKQSARLESRCRACNHERRIQRHADNREATNDATRRHHAANRAQINQRAREYYAAHLTEKRIEGVVFAQKRRLKGYDAGVKAIRVVTEQVFEMARVGDLYLDAYSGELIEKPTIDHVIPISAGGTHVFENLCVTSRANNSSKHHTPLLVWLARKAREANARRN